ncbi:hypothetical protein Acr_26g0000480 [Actinidia rufa]|uniref:Uncharacterized protein n=1 Tax=Actinidia rufa TaxID=165716 RepID=A0A7J0H194_9ERIC|nr:hypothetical protein Acr_26g0000480 [Actinidia rufa]
MLDQHHQSVAEYFTELSGVWQEFDFYQEFQVICTADGASWLERLEKERAYDFLAGLDVEYDQIRVCNYCQNIGHIRNFCWKLHGRHPRGRGSGHSGRGRGRGKHRQEEEIFSGEGEKLVYDHGEGTGDRRKEMSGEEPISPKRATRDISVPDSLADSSGNDSSSIEPPLINYVDFPITLRKAFVEYRSLVGTLPYLEATIHKATTLLAVLDDRSVVPLSFRMEG